ncbi:hypothetical protein TUMSATVNIG3_57010 (plasmid) [Vibrio nigripulchritudo]|nr:hypothetical protein TUMSATVNIG3_57010 [Vibrio nigripulchritudo]
MPFWRCINELFNATSTVGLDPLTEHLKNLDPTQVDALEMMRGVYSNQITLCSALVSLQHHSYDTDNAITELSGTDINVLELADSVAANALPRLDAIITELEKQSL